MKTVITTTIENYEIIMGLDQAVIDPIETRKNVKSLLNGSAEVKAYLNKIAEIEVRNKNITQTKKIISSAYMKLNGIKSTDIDKADAQTQIENETAKLKIELEQKKSLISELIPFKKNINSKKKEIFEANKVYFDTKSGEKIISDADYISYSDKIKNLAPGKLLCTDNTEIFDKRGVRYWKKLAGGWKETEIIEINKDVPSGGKLYENLTDAEKTEIIVDAEKDRISALSLSDKTTEKDSAIEGLALQAATMRSKLEIQGASASSALSQSKTWYDAEVLLVNTKYA